MKPIDLHDSENIAAALHSYHTRDTQAWNDHRMEQTVQNSVELPEKNTVRKPLKFGK